MTGYFQINKAADGRLSFSLKAGNHEVILTSAMFETALDVRDAIAMVRHNSSVEARFERKVAKDNSPYFVLKTVGGKTLGRSEMYSSAAAMIAGIQSVMANGASSVVKVSETA